MVVTAYRPSVPPGRVARTVWRLLGAGAAAMVVSAASAWWISAVELPRWWLILSIGLPATVGAGWATLDRGRWPRLGAGLVLTVSCALVTWWIWVPVPPVIATLRAHERAATASAQQVIATTAPRTCRVPTATDLGPLGPVGPWSQICVEGLDGPGWRDVYLSRPTGSDEPSLGYYTQGFRGGDGLCSQHVVGRWWAFVQPGTGGPTGTSCPDHYQLDGSG